MRSLITWMGGPEGYINTNPGVAIESRHCAVGLMDMGPGQRQPGVHTHTMNEIYVILDGEVQSFDGVGNRHHAGPLDCLYIPKGVPHGVRTVGDRPVKLLWVNDEIERWGVSLYQQGDGPFPAANGREVRLIRFVDLEPDWSGPRGREGGFMHWSVSWTGGRYTGPNHNPDIAEATQRAGISMSVLLPACRLDEPTTAGNELLVVMRGCGVVETDMGNELVTAQDAVFCPAGMKLRLRSLGDAPLHLVRVREAVVA